MIRILFFILLLSPTCTLIAQSNFNGWIATFNTFKLNSKFSIHFDAQVRSTHQLKHFNTFLIRPGLNWHFRKNMIATLGYGFVSHRRVASGLTGFAPEHRIWQQLIINHPVGFSTLQHRFRLEERFVVKHFVENGEFKKEGNFYTTRLRYFNRAIIPLNGSKSFSHGLYGAIQNEIFVNIGDNTPVNGKFFDQNRLYLGAGYRLSKLFDLEVGYMNQYIQGTNKTFTNNHILQVATYLRL